jgi:cell wall-associated NlpC family hydrolase
MSSDETRLPFVARFLSAAFDPMTSIGSLLDQDDALSRNGHIACCGTKPQQLKSILPHSSRFELKQDPKLIRRIENPLTVRTLFPRLLVVCFAFLLTAGVAAQSSESDSRTTRTTVDSNGGTRLEREMSTPPSVAERRPQTVGANAVTGRFDQLLLTAIQSHLGATYYYTGTGPDSFDCSGFVWRTFQETGLNFSRGPARSYWATFAPPPKGEDFKFGTLVFFSGLAHVGIVADEHGFYHSSRHHGVVYSPFNDYWLSRIDGFRRVPLDLMQTPLMNQKARAAKPATTVTNVEEDNQP